jgi:transposase
MAKSSACFAVISSRFWEHLKKRKITYAKARRRAVAAQADGLRTVR